MNIVAEEWRKVGVDFPSYSVSDQGRVRNDKTGRILSGTTDPDGYGCICLKGTEKIKGFFIHRLVAAAFMDGFDPLLTVNHKNGVKKDNRLCNLENISQGENVRHAIKTGLRVQARKLTQAQAELIRKSVRRGISKRFLARWFGVSETVVAMIIKGTRYRQTAA